MSKKKTTTVKDKNIQPQTEERGWNKPVQPTPPPPHITPSPPQGGNGGQGGSGGQGGNDKPSSEKKS